MNIFFTYFLNGSELKNCTFLFKMLLNVFDNVVQHVELDGKHLVDAVPGQIEDEPVKLIIVIRFLTSLSTVRLKEI